MWAHHRYSKLAKGVVGHLGEHVPQPMDVPIVPGFDLPLDLREDVDAAVFLDGADYELPTAAILLEWAERADVFFDIGANCGLFSAVLAGRSDVAVHAFEPQPALATRLAEAGCRSGRPLTVHALGLGDEPGTFPLHGSASLHGRTTFGDHPEYHDVVGEARVARFDDWRREVGLDLPDGPRWIAKLDIEGYELRALRGMEEALAARAFVGLVVELNAYTLRFAGTDVDEVVAHLAERGYRRRTGGAIPPDHLNGFFEPAP